MFHLDAWIFRYEQCNFNGISENMHALDMWQNHRMKKNVYGPNATHCAKPKMDLARNGRVCVRKKLKGDSAEKGSPGIQTPDLLDQCTLWRPLGYKCYCDKRGARAHMNKNKGLIWVSQKLVQKLMKKSKWRLGFDPETPWVHACAVNQMG